MKSFLTKIASSAANVALIILACVLAGLGLWLVFVLALFALAVIGLSFLAAPLLALIQPDKTDEAETVTA
ncbi:MAG: hypothetical protein OXC60_09625 [Litoreibacter sp.]|nr:hypothetical protein [Litoreibacter sp.]MCY4334918.1 hypothetical protein [Litoreibacter sp.]